MRIRTFGALTALATLALGCGDDEGRGSLRVQLLAEDTITEGLEPGQGEENTRDYGVTYTKYLVAIGRVTLSRSRGGEVRKDDSVYIADMLQVGTQGLDLTEFSDLPTGQWDRFGFETPVAPPGAKPLPGVSAADAQAMIDQQLTYWIEGTVDRPGQPVRFSFRVAAPTVFTDCRRDGEPGVAIAEGGRTSANVTLHGDHLWFDSLLAGSEQTVVRRAQWLVDADRNGDGLVDNAELASFSEDALFPRSKMYDFSSHPIPRSNALDVVRTLLMTQGHFNGEGDCSWDAGS